jgi:hypothetical protein
VASRKATRWVLLLLGLGVLVAGGLVAVRAASGVLRGRLVAALGPGAQVRALRLGWTGVEVEGLRLGASPEWPVPDALRAERVAVGLRWWSLLTSQVRVDTVTVVRPYLSAVRARDGEVDVVPSLRRDPAPGLAPALPAPTRAVAIARITVRDGALDLFDASLGSPPLRIRLEEIQATVAGMVAPSMTGKVDFDVTAVVRGTRDDGQAYVVGWVEPVSGDASVRSRFRRLDLAALQPYFASGVEARVERGTLDLDLDSEIQRQRLQAPGRAVITDLAFGPAQSPRETFLGVPRDAVLRFLRSRHERIDVSFVLEGDVANPQFTLREELATRLAVAPAGELGVSVEGAVQAVRELARRALEAPAGATKDVGRVLRHLFGGRSR